jgi:iron complex transport system substrate-binding protein
MKIVSLLPAASEIVCALGLRRSLVGRSHECDYPADVAELPALTRARVDSSLSSAALDAAVRHVMADGAPLYDLDDTRLAALAPDVVVTQEACEVCAVAYDQVVECLERAAVRARVVSLRPSRLAHVLGDVVRVARACGAADRGTALAGEMERRLERLARVAASRPRVAVVEWLDPPMLAGHWVPDVLERVGATPLGPAPGQPSTYVGWNEIAALAPDAVVVAACGFDLERTLREATPHAETLRRLAPRVLLMDGNAYLNRPGPRLVDAAETLAAWLQGAPIDPDRARALSAAAAARS